MSETLQEAFDEAGPWDMTQGELDVLYESRGEPESMEEQRKMLLAFEQHAFSSQ
ncbi:hypothetical protein [Paraburkholderia sp. Clong3]|uniref:hypothetical protein n=1 Tax=Paraburkholderia sp. Clong3 TaxID=2991061 RepID=UPI003D1E1018